MKSSCGFDIFKYTDVIVFIQYFRVFQLIDDITEYTGRLLGCYNFWHCRCHDERAQEPREAENRWSNVYEKSSISVTFVHFDNDVDAVDSTRPFKTHFKTWRVLIKGVPYGVFLSAL